MPGTGIQGDPSVRLESDRHSWRIRLSRISTAQFQALLTIAESQDAYGVFTRDGVRYQVRLMTVSGVRQHPAREGELGAYAWDAYVYIKRSDTVQLLEPSMVLPMPFTEEGKFKLKQLFGVDLV